MTYAPLGKARFTIARAPDGETLTISAIRYWIVIPFLAVWLGAWTIGGLTAVVAFIAAGEPFLAIWLVGWAIGECIVALILLGMLTGKEVLRITADGELDYACVMRGFSRRSLYRGQDIRDIRPTGVTGAALGRSPLPLPLFGNPRGALGFTYGARAVRLAAGLDPVEGGQIAAWMQDHLEAGVSR